MTIIEAMQPKGFFPSFARSVLIKLNSPYSIAPPITITIKCLMADELNI